MGMANANDSRDSQGSKTAYYRIAGHLPESAQRLLMEYLPHLEASVDDDVRRFGKELADDLKERTHTELCVEVKTMGRALNAIEVQEKNGAKRNDKEGAKKNDKGVDSGRGILERLSWTLILLISV